MCELEPGSSKRQRTGLETYKVTQVDEIREERADRNQQQFENGSADLNSSIPGKKEHVDLENPLEHQDLYPECTEDESESHHQASHAVNSVPEEDSIVRWWSAVEDLGPSEFAKRTNNAYSRATRARPKIKQRNDVPGKFTPLLLDVQPIAEQMECLADNVQLKSLHLPRLSQQGLKQVI